MLVALRRNTSKSDNNFSIIWDFRFGLSFSWLSHTTFIFRLTLSLVEQHDGNNKTHPRKYTNIRINQRKWQKPSRMKIGCDALVWSALSRCTRCTVYACIFHYWAYVFWRPNRQTDFRLYLSSILGQRYIMGTMVNFSHSNVLNNSKKSMFMSRHKGSNLQNVCHILFIFFFFWPTVNHTNSKTFVALDWRNW